VTVPPGETKTVEVAVPASRFAYWDVARKAFVVETGSIALVAGDSSAHLPLKTTITTR
jgi:hypothetical protein